MSGRWAFAGTEAGVVVLVLDLAGAGIVTNVAPDDALINPPESAVTGIAYCLAPLATAGGVCYAGAFGIGRKRHFING